MRRLATVILACCVTGCIGGVVPPGYSATQLPDNGPPGVCQALATQAVQTSDGFLADEYLWYDHTCSARRIDLVRNTIMDPTQQWGGYAHRITYKVNGSERDCIGTTQDHPGYGSVVNHTSATAFDSLWQQGTGYTTLFAGRHHAFHQFTTKYDISGQPVSITIQWMMATGRDSPIWAITFDSSAAEPNSIVADTRAPYGDINWDADASGQVEGVGWGDHYKFVSLDSPVTLEGGWDYTQANTVPYVIEWSASHDAEMGFVQTQTYMQHDAGGYDFYTSWGQKSAAGPMPVNYNWTYQLNQYELDEDLASKRIAWGSNFGAVGQASYAAYGGGRNLSGYPYQSYAGFVVLGTHTQGAVAAQVSEIETVQQTQLTATVPTTVATTGLAGVGRSDVQTYDIPGYNPIYGTWAVDVGGGGTVQLQMVVAQGTLHAPVFEVRHWQTTQPPSQVTFGGQALTADIDYFASVDPKTQTLWLTLPRSVLGSNTLQITP